MIKIKTGHGVEFAACSGKGEVGPYKAYPTSHGRCQTSKIVPYSRINIVTSRKIENLIMKVTEYLIQALIPESCTITLMNAMMSMYDIVRGELAHFSKNHV